MQKDNTSVVLYQLVQALDIPVTRQSIEDETAKHPEYSSLLAISELLNHWRIPNAAYHLSFEELPQVPVPFVVFFQKKKFSLVIRLNEQQATVLNEHGKSQVMPIEEFRKSYSGSILIAEKDPDSGEVDYTQKRRKELWSRRRTPAALIGAGIFLPTFLLVNSTYISSFSLQIGLLTLFKTAGLTTAVLLLMQSIDANNPLIQKLCTGANNKDCNAILSSKAAKITNELSWSEAGFFYFAGTWLVLLFNSGNTSLLQALAILNIISLPYTFYSIYYQWRVAKHWCLFCCTVQGLLWLEFFAFLPSLMQGLQPLNVTGWCNLVIGMAIPVLAWILAKPYLLQGKQIQSFKQQLRQFKYNSTLFNKLLNEETKYDLPQDDSSLIIGNREAETIITMVSNPFCQPCSSMHKRLDALLQNRSDIKLQVVFFTHDAENDKKSQVAAHLMSLQAGRDNRSLKKALDDWYEQKQKSFETWAKEHPVKEQVDSQASLQIQREWCKTAKITGTPTVFINGRRLPHNYQPEDIRYFL
jgi:uncharacterized membrane protein